MVCEDISLHLLTHTLTSSSSLSCAAGIGLCAVCHPDGLGDLEARQTAAVHGRQRRRHGAQCDCREAENYISLDIFIHFQHMDQCSHMRKPEALLWSYLIDRQEEVMVCNFFVNLIVISDGIEIYSGLICISYPSDLVLFFQLWNSEHFITVSNIDCQHKSFVSDKETHKTTHSCTIVMSHGGNADCGIEFHLGSNDVVTFSS